ncbi:MAG: 4-alpha-glucanotransferase [Deltaproteobacteria bacterium]|nr:4-alpha-glucanotransferase [Deltaproteobacteria bacterium]
MTSNPPRTAGILLHPTCLPGPHGVGDLGAGARRFVEWLGEAGVALWQILPLVPPGPGESPYGTTSALAGNPWLVSLADLVDDGLLAASDLEGPPAFPLDWVDPAAMKAYKGPLLDKAADALLDGANGELAAAFAGFREEQPWVDDTALFLAIRAAHGERPWWEWPEGLRDRAKAALTKAKKDLGREIDRAAALQFLFDHQWRALRRLCEKHGVIIVGDLPIYVDRDSADVWANRDQFRLHPDGSPIAVAGVPPDFFSETGQLWGNPLYDWERMARDGHGWWVQRLQRARELTDVVRLDHFRGFSAFWEVPAGASDARGGKWVDGPGTALFADLSAALGHVPLIAEDLGVIDDGVIALREALGLPGMRILQFAFGEEADHPFLPHNYVAHCVCYTGTHDNDTTLGWWQSTSDRVRDHVRRYLATSGQDIVWDLIRAAFASVASMAVVPLQDVLRLDGRTRMNTPGTVENNWRWRVRIQAFNSPLAHRVRELVALYGRLPAADGG